MKETIINKATSLFLTLGFKSVTMDDIANDLGISKKTIYTYFDNKTSLVEAGTTHLFKKITDGIKDIKTKSLDPITELHDIKIFLMNSLKGEKTSPYHQLQKYYPSIHKELKIKKFDFVLENLYCLKYYFFYQCLTTISKAEMRIDCPAKVFLKNRIFLCKALSSFGEN